MYKIYNLLYMHVTLQRGKEPILKVKESVCECSLHFLTLPNTMYLFQLKNTIGCFILYYTTDRPVTVLYPRE